MTRRRMFRLQVMLTEAELSIIDDFQAVHHLPSRAAAVRDLLDRGFTATVPPKAGSRQSRTYGVTLRPTQ
jgi:hypothetical protein